MDDMSRTLPAALLTAAALLLTGCTASESSPAGDAAASGSGDTASDPLEPLDPRDSMTGPGAEQYGDGQDGAGDRPRYDVDAEADPVSGEVSGTLRAQLPVAELSEVTFRFFPHEPSLEADAEVGQVLVDGEDAEAVLDGTLLTVVLPDGASDPVVEVPFSYTLADQEAGGLAGGLGGALLGGDLSPAEVGLLARRADSLALGHWFPLWIPPGRSADPVLDGYGDLGNFDPADISVSLDVPDGWSVVDSGVPIGDPEAGEDTVTFRSSGAGMRDYAVAVLRGTETRTRTLSGDLGEVTISATGPTDAADELDAVLDETETSIEVLSEKLGAYPWREYDVVSMPLGASVGGMEWPGATWIEAGTFAGGIPGLGDLDGMLGGLDLGELDLGDLDLGGLDLGGLGLDGMDTLLGSARLWTIAHEVAHSWWTVIVGNDSLAAPVVDEPLAQYSACLVARELSPEGDEICAQQIGVGYEQMRQLGQEDGPADRPSDAFSSALQYGGLVYGKAASFWLTLEEEYGARRVATALREIVSSSAYDELDGPGLRALLVNDLGAEAGTLWDRWMVQTHGDDDLGVDPGAGIGGLGELGGLGDLEGMLGGLDLGNLNPEDLAPLLEQFGGGEGLTGLLDDPAALQRLLESLGGATGTT